MPNLCQPDGRKACGACCGMYNIVGGARETIEAILRARTRTFAETCDIRDPESLRRYKAARLEIEQDAKLLDQLRNCPFLGVLDARTGRVGCMVHPAVNDGIDGRDCGVYDRETCQDYLCAAYTTLSAEERRLVIEACDDDSFMYGLVLNDVHFVRALFEHAAEITGMWARGPRLFDEAVLDAVRAWFALKAEWPWRDPESGVIGAWLPHGGRRIRRRAIDYASLGVEKSRFDDVLRALGSLFDSVEALQEAEAVIWGRVHDFATAWDDAVMASERARQIR